jgi:hypothetical protein
MYKDIMHNIRGSYAALLVPLVRYRTLAPGLRRDSPAAGDQLRSPIGRVALTRARTALPKLVNSAKIPSSTSSTIREARRGQSMSRCARRRGERSVQRGYDEFNYLCCL